MSFQENMQLFEMISKHGPVSDELRADIISKLLFRAFKKKDKILKEGQVCNYLYFVAKGLLRGYHVRNNGEDISNWFKMENDFMTSVKSFYKRVPSFEEIEVLEDCELYYIHYNDLEGLYRKHLEFNTIAEKITRHYWTRKEKLIRVIRGSAIEKYKFLLANRKEIIARVPLKYIASYIGICPETLSRIRRL